MSLNKVQLIGRLGQDPELKTLPNGNSVCNMTVATSEKWTDKQGERHETTEWHRVQCWKKTAENCATYLAKGSQVYLEGKLQTRSWDKDGEKRYSTEINANVVQFLGGKSDSNTTVKSVTPEVVGKTPEFTSDQIPF